MKKIIAIICTLSLLTLASCSNTTNTIGNGKVDPAEAAAISLSVGIVLNTNPQLVKPANAVSKALLVVLSGDLEIMTIPFVKDAVAKEVAKLNLNPMDQQSFNDLMVLVSIEINNNFDKIGIADADKLVVIRDIIKIVEASSAVRLNITK